VTLGSKSGHIVREEVGMADKLKAPIMILIVLILVSLFFAGGIFSILQKERAKNLDLREELENVKIEQRTAQTKLEDSKKMLSALEVKLQDAQGQIDALARDLEQEKSAKLQASAQAEQLKMDLEKQKSLSSDLENKLTLAQEEVKKTQDLLNGLDSQKTELETKIKDLEAKVQQAQEQGVELGKIVVNPEGTETAEAISEGEKTGARVLNLEGKVLVVNKDYNFVVINLGSKDGIGIGNIFSVYQDNKYLGDVKVEKVHDSMAAADFASVDMKDKVNEGDKVVQKTK